MIQSFRSKALRDYFETGKPKGVPANLAKRAMIRLDALDNAVSLEELKYWRCHPLNTDPVRYALDVNGPWRITFEWRNGDAYLVDLEQYH
jgi:proteic killer suppression protein